MTKVFIHRNVCVQLHPYKRYGKFTLDALRGMYSKSKDGIYTFGKRKLKINFNNVRYRTFFEHGCSCAVCGLEGKFFVIGRFVRSSSRKGQGQHHFFLFGIDENGDEVEISHQRGTNHAHPPICAKCIDSTEELIR